MLSNGGLALQVAIDESNNFVRELIGTCDGAAVFCAVNDGRLLAVFCPVAREAMCLPLYAVVQWPILNVR